MPFTRFLRIETLEHTGATDRNDPPDFLALEPRGSAFLWQSTERFTRKLKTASTSRVKRIAILGNYIPRQCGIATYTADVATHLQKVKPGIEVSVIAMNDRDGYKYCSPVIHSVTASDRSEYEKAAKRLNEANFDMVNVQHEFGIFGGEAGEYLLDFMRAVNMPIVTTVHTVLVNPNEAQRRVFLEVLELSERVVSMTQKGIEILNEVYGVPRSKIDFIHHGIPDVDRQMAREIRRDLGSKGAVILTFGLIGRDKGIHTMIEAMPEIVAKSPGATYVVVGATHPHLRAHQGESYRSSLEQRVVELGLENNVRFVNRFVSNEELAGWLGATDVYVTPYLKEEQITSGTLAYALGNGNAVVSTPFWHASELLAEDRGVLVPFGEVTAMADAICEILTDTDRRSSLCQKASEYGEEMRWPNVAERFLESFERARMEGEDRLRKILIPDSAFLPVAVAAPPVVPTVSLEYLKSMTDDTGMFQHAIYHIPNHAEGYCTDDNARALMLMIKLGAPQSPDPAIRKLYRTYLAFVANSYDHELRHFRNFMSFDRKWLERVGSDDSNARALWSLASVARADKGPNGEYALHLTIEAISALDDSEHLRTLGFRMLALNEINQYDAGMALRLHRSFKNHCQEGWTWFEDKLTYDNARLSQALIQAGSKLGEPMLTDGLKSLEWLMQVQTGPNGVFAGIGSEGFWDKGGNRAWFDQQPLEAWASVSACLSAAKITGDVKWEREAERAFAWFLGENMTQTVMAHSGMGACSDGLQAVGVNMNCGAESTLSYLMALLELRAYRQQTTAPHREMAIETSQWIPGPIRATS